MTIKIKIDKIEKSDTYNGETVFKIEGSKLNWNGTIDVEYAYTNDDKLRIKCYYLTIESDSSLTGEEIQRSFQVIGRWGEKHVRWCTEYTRNHTGFVSARDAKKAMIKYIQQWGKVEETTVETVETTVEETTVETVETTVEETPVEAVETPVEETPVEETTVEETTVDLSNTLFKDEDKNIVVSLFRDDDPQHAKSYVEIDKVNSKKMSKKQLIQEIYIKLQAIDDLVVTDKERLSIAKHISKMPKSARNAFINALEVLLGKALEYDFMQNDW